MATGYIFGPMCEQSLIFLTLAYGFSVLLVFLEHVTHRCAPFLVAGVLVCGSAVSVALSFINDHVLLLDLAFGLFMASAIVRYRLIAFSNSGVLMMVSLGGLLIVVLVMTAHFVITSPVSDVTRILMLSAYLVTLLALPAALVHMHENWEVLVRRRWNRLWDALPPAPRSRYPRVSIHVPAHAEPPEVVFGTLDALAFLHYPNFEVLVIDNNTTNPLLWRPVAEHCKRLGPRFHFFHVEGIKGAKAGALNFALRHTDPTAELVGLVDADYQVKPDFLDRLVGHFDDPGIGFVQTPHDYRDWERSTYLRMCYWEYRNFFSAALVSKNERRAAVTVGTMCLIRRSALEAAGGWAEWCVTEDSELAIRIHALGYSSGYVGRSFGYGLIPDTFAGYKRQRFRWTYGPVQELKRHWRLFIPWPLGTPSRLTWAQKVHHLSHGLGCLMKGTSLLGTPLVVAATVSGLLFGELAFVPLALWLLAAVMLLTGFLLRWSVYMFIIGCSLKDAMGAAVAMRALSHTVAVASLWGLLTRTIPWRRTNKFPASSSVGRALRSAGTELLLGIGTLSLGATLVVAAPRSGLLMMLGIGAIVQAAWYLPAPIIAIFAEHDLWNRTHSNYLNDVSEPP